MIDPKALRAAMLKYREHWDDFDEKHMIKVLEAYEAEKPSKWQPIETAKKDGAIVQLRVMFNEPLNTAGSWEHTCWRYYGDDGCDDNQPTHWRPLEALSVLLCSKNGDY